MASILKVDDAWRAQVRRKGHKSVSETFPTKAQAQAWARKVEAEMDARRFMDARGLANITLKELIDWYSQEIGGVQVRRPPVFAKERVGVSTQPRKVLDGLGQGVIVVVALLPTDRSMPASAKRSLYFIDTFCPDSAGHRNTSILARPD